MWQVEIVLDVNGVSLGEKGRGFGVAEVVLRGFSSSLIAQFVGHLYCFKACAKMINYKGLFL